MDLLNCLFKYMLLGVFLFCFLTCMLQGMDYCWNVNFWFTKIQLRMSPSVKRIPVLRFYIFTGFSSNVYYCIIPAYIYFTWSSQINTSQDCHSCGNSIVKKKMLLMSSNHCSNITTLIKQTNKQNFSVFFWYRQGYSVFWFHFSL